jgi:phospholipase C
VLKLIEWRWNLPPLTARDASSEVTNLAYALDFNQPVTSVPALPEVSAPTPTPCGQGGILSSGGNQTTGFFNLLNSGLMAGWPLPAGLP